MAALLEAKDVRVDDGGVPAVDGVKFATTGAQVVMIGAPRVLFEACAGMRPVAHGQVLVEGVSAEQAVDDRLVAGAPLDPPLPPTWTPRRYVEESAALSGVARADRRRLVGAAIDKLELGPVADAPLGKAVPHARRATVVAAAIATGAKTILLDDPLAGLADDVARNFGKIVLRAIDGVRWVVFAGRLPLMSPLCIAADEAIVLSSGDVVSQGAPAEIAVRESAFVVRIAGEGAKFSERLATREARVVPTGDTFTIELPAGASTSVVFAAAEEAGTVVLELRPVARGFV
ncbi:MAG: hypothetical protein JNL38_23325 [Myxococcales bacterium]|nr:hypothetical protein [Myxococcales bacterium]